MEHPSKLAQILAQDEKLSQTQIEEALILQRQSNELIGQLLIKLGYATEDDVLSAIDNFRRKISPSQPIHTIIRFPGLIPLS